MELVDVYVRFGERLRRGCLTRTLGKTKLVQELSPHREFGEERVEFEVPEFSGPAESEVTVSLNSAGRSATT